jgi:lipopolysaccharide/colanic/teichoic acid biosynthesis glycosyltransferase
MLPTPVQNESAISMKKDSLQNHSASFSKFSHRARHAFYPAYGKRMLDIIVVILFLPIVLPLVALLVAWVAKDGGKPIFSHERIGMGGRTFRCLKIRTMVLDSEERLKAVLRDDPAAAIEWARDFKLRNDPRITRIGRILRTTSLDELPQLWNVFRGDMSLVGPRPVTAEELPRYAPHIDAYCSVRPGVTGIWQVSGRNDLSFAERVKLDRDYVRKLSMTNDLSILFWTVPTVLRRTGC